jgi:hypothetical protein
MFCKNLKCITVFLIGDYRSVNENLYQLRLWILALIV